MPAQVIDKMRQLIDDERAATNYVSKTKDSVIAEMLERNYLVAKNRKNYKDKYFRYSLVEK